MNKFFWSIAGMLLLGMSTVQGQEAAASRSFELRYFTDSTIANGTIDFSGDSTFFSTEDRMAYLESYLAYSKQFFYNPDLDLQPVLPDEVREATANFKSMPNLEARQRIALDTWKFRTDKRGLRQQQERHIEEWTKVDGAAVANDALYLTKNFSHNKNIGKQDWRFTLEWDAKIPKTKERSAFLLLDEKSNPVVLVGVTATGQCFYKSQLAGLPIGMAQFKSDTLINFKLFVDVESGRFSIWLNGEQKADFVRTLSKEPVHKMYFKLPKGSTLDNLYGVRYERPIVPKDPKEQVPIPKGYVFVDERFELVEEIGDLGLARFQDSTWQEATLPLASGDRYRDRDLILRKHVRIDTVARAILHVEQLSPETEIWINNRSIHVNQTSEPFQLDITNALRMGSKNLIMLRLRGGDGWKFGKAWLELTDATYIQDAYVHTTRLSDTAFLQLDAHIQSQARDLTAGLWEGEVQVNVYPWSPRAAATPVASMNFPFSTRVYQKALFSEVIPIRRPKLWSPDNPNLYKIELRLITAAGEVVDDYALITGIRKVSQEGGVVRLNDKPLLLHGANLSDFVPYNVSTYEQPEDPAQKWLVRTLLSIKEMNGNAVRIGELENLNKNEVLRLCDQLGLAVIFQTDTSDEPWLANQQLASTIERFRGHPSIILWQGADNLRFNNYFEDALPWMEQYHQTITQLDSTRLISMTGGNPYFGINGTPNDDGTRLYDDQKRRYRLLRSSSIWTNPKVVRSGIDPSISYGGGWNDLRPFPVSLRWDTLRLNYLHSPQHAYLDVQSEGLAGQENPRTVKGSPYRYAEFYRLPYAEYLIGQDLEFEDWEFSQAWQAFTAYEAYRKKRWLGYDGLIWSSIFHGGTPTTLIDANGYAKLAYHTVRMSAQPLLAGSQTTDLAYSNTEEIPVFVSNVGRARNVQVTVKVKGLSNGRTLQTQTFNGRLNEGNQTLELGTWTHNLPTAGWYVVEYEVR